MALWRSFQNSLLHVLIIHQFLSTCSIVHAQSLTPLIDDFSRGELGQIASELIEPGTKGFGPRFMFPDSASSSYLYGIDISHHNFSKGNKLDWGALPERRVRFVYMKASQGSRFFDPTFARNWQEAGKVDGLLRGAYHFLSADADPKIQAESFLTVLATSSDFKATRDLPPVLDLEWDLKRASDGTPLKDSTGKLVDGWKALNPSEIASRVDLWLNTVSLALNTRPIIYTNAEWWKSVGLERTSFSSEPVFWVSDYSVKSNMRFAPLMIPQYRWTIWQFTERSLIDNREFDANVVVDSADTFARKMGIEK